MSVDVPDRLPRPIHPGGDGRPRTYLISALDDFINITTWLYTSERVLFRGQRNDWPLLPATWRETDPLRAFWEDAELLAEFKREAVPYVKFTPRNDWHWLALARHSGVPTRLLDWSINPLVALWFAVKDPQDGNAPGIVWALPYGEPFDFFPADEEVSPFSVDRTSVFFPDHVSPLIQAQMGAFTVHPRENSPAKDCVPLERSHHADSALTRIEIPAKKFSALRNQLSRIGVRPSSLIPGLEGIAERIRYDRMFSADEPALRRASAENDGTGRR